MTDEIPNRRKAIETANTSSAEKLPANYEKIAQDSIAFIEEIVKSYIYAANEKMMFSKDAKEFLKKAGATTANTHENIEKVTSYFFNQIAKETGHKDKIDIKDPKSVYKFAKNIQKKVLKGLAPILEEYPHIKNHIFENGDYKKIRDGSLNEPTMTWLTYVEVAKTKPDFIKKLNEKLSPEGIAKRNKMWLGTFATYKVQEIKNGTNEKFKQMIINSTGVSLEEAKKVDTKNQEQLEKIGIRMIEHAAKLIGISVSLDPSNTKKFNEEVMKLKQELTEQWEKLTTEHPEYKNWLTKPNMKSKELEYLTSALLIDLAEDKVSPDELKEKHKDLYKIRNEKKQQISTGKQNLKSEAQEPKTQEKEITNEESSESFMRDYTASLIKVIKSRDPKTQESLKAHYGFENIDITQTTNLDLAMRTMYEKMAMSIGVEILIEPKDPTSFDKFTKAVQSEILQLLKELAEKYPNIKKSIIKDGDIDDLQSGKFNATTNMWLSRLAAEKDNEMFWKLYDETLGEKEEPKKNPPVKASSTPVLDFKYADRLKELLPNAEKIAKWNRAKNSETALLEYGKKLEIKEKLDYKNDESVVKYVLAMQAKVYIKNSTLLKDGLWGNRSIRAMEEVLGTKEREATSKETENNLTAKRTPKEQPKSKEIVGEKVSVNLKRTPKSEWKKWDKEKKEKERVIYSINANVKGGEDTWTFGSSTAARLEKTTKRGSIGLSGARPYTIMPEFKKHVWEKIKPLKMPRRVVLAGMAVNGLCSNKDRSGRERSDEEIKRSVRKNINAYNEIAKFWKSQGVQVVDRATVQIYGPKSRAIELFNQTLRTEYSNNLIDIHPTTADLGSDKLHFNKAAKLKLKQELDRTSKV